MAAATAWAGKNTAVAKREGYFFEVVPPIYPAAPGMFERAIPIEGLNLQPHLEGRLGRQSMKLTPIGEVALEFGTLGLPRSASCTPRSS